MPEATVLYSVMAVVIAGLVLWVVFVLKTAKEPWAREVPPGVLALAPDVTLRADGAAEPLADADSTARATPVALGDATARTAAEVPGAAKDRPGDEEADV